MISSNLNCEMSCTKNIINRRRSGSPLIKKCTEILQNCITNLLVSLFALDNSEEFSFSVCIKSPRIVIKREEAVAIEISLASLSRHPFMIENLSLLLEIHVVVEGVIIKLIIRKLIILHLQLIPLIKNIHHLNHSLHNLLLEYFFHDDNGDVELEFLDDGGEVFFF